MPSKYVKRQSLLQAQEGLDILAAWDFEVQQFGPYHFRINGRLDVWPSTKKWWDGQTGKKGVYEHNLENFVRDYFKGDRGLSTANKR